MAAPAVGNLNDDNGDGVVGEGDIPDVVFASFSGSSYRSPGTLTAISGDDGAVLFEDSGKINTQVFSFEMRISSVDNPCTFVCSA